MLAFLKRWFRCGRLFRTKMEPYFDSIEHLREEIGRLDILLRQAVLVARQPSPGAGSDEFRGLVVTENEVDDILRATNIIGDYWQRTEARRPELTQIESELDKRRKQIDSRIEASRQKGIQLALPSLAG